jgi:hypothetical protein
MSLNRHRTDDIDILQLHNALPLDVNIGKDAEIIQPRLDIKGKGYFQANGFSLK